MAAQASPFKTYVELYPGAAMNQVSGSAVDVSTHATRLQALADHLTSDGRAAMRQVEGDLVALAPVRANRTASDARTLSANGHFASAVLLDFVGDVEAFDTSVDSLNREYQRRLARAGNLAAHGLDEHYDPVATGRAIEASLRPQYNAAENRLDTAIDTAVSRFRNGATDESVRELFRAGLIPLSAQSSFPTVRLTPEDISTANANVDDVTVDLLKWLGLVPNDTSARDLLAYGSGISGLAFGSFVDWRTKMALSRFQPNLRLPTGMRRFLPMAPYQGFGFTAMLNRGKAVLTPGTHLFTANPHRATNVSRWSTAGRWAGRTGGVVTALTAGWSQWEQDADDPTLSDGDRIRRTATSSVTTAGGALLGAKGGAMTGAAIGTVIGGPVGTVIGGAIGGLVGGAIGAGVGDKVGDFINDNWDDATETVSNLAEDAGEKLKDIGDTLSFWD